MKTEKNTIISSQKMLKTPRIVANKKVSYIII